MARVDYFAIEQAIQQVLLADEDLRDRVTVLVEAGVTPEREPLVVIHLDRREAPANLQTLSAGTTTHLRLRFSILCYSYALEVAELMRLRDDLTGKVEVALMRNPTFNGAVELSWLEGGEFETPAKSDEGFAMWAEVALVADVTARTTT